MLEAALGATKPNKRGGTDALTYDVLKHLPMHAKEILRARFGARLNGDGDSDNPPESWHQLATVLIQKKARSTDMKDLRPITNFRGH